MTVAQPERACAAEGTAAAAQLPPACQGSEALAARRRRDCVAQQAQQAAPAARGALLPSRGWAGGSPCRTACRTADARRQLTTLCCPSPACMPPGVQSQPSSMRLMHTQASCSNSSSNQNAQKGANSRGPRPSCRPPFGSAASNQWEGRARCCQAPVRLLPRLWKQQPGAGAAWAEGLTAGRPSGQSGAAAPAASQRQGSIHRSASPY